jgi:AsmA-like C-terminal region
VWQQNGDGDWVVPRLPEEARQKAVEKPEPKKAEATVAATGGKKKGLEVVVEGFQIRDGALELLDRKGRVQASCQGVNVRYTSLSSEKMEGNAHLERLSWGAELAFENVRTPFLYVGREISLSDLQATLAGGTVGGKFTLKTEGKKPPFTLSLTLDRIDAGLLSTKMHSALGKAAGAIGGTLELHGNARDLEDVEGTGSLLVRDGRVQQLELFEAIADVLQLKELSDLKLKEGRANFRLGEERAHLDEIVLEAADLRLSAKGEVRFDGRIQLASRLSIEDALRKHLPGLIRGNFEKEEDTGRHAIAFDITGKDFRMKTNLLDRVVGKKVTSQFDDLLTSLFGKKKEKKEEPKTDKKKEGEAKSAAPIATQPDAEPPAPPPGAEPRAE